MINAKRLDAATCLLCMKNGVRALRGGSGIASFFALSIFLISPIISLPFIFYGIYVKEKLSFFLLALFGGVLTYMLHPDWELDIARYYELYHNISEMTFSDFLTFLKGEKDFLFYCIYYLFSLLGIGKFQIVLLILSTFEFYVSFWVFSKIIDKQNVSANNRFFLFGLFLLSLPVLAIISTTRFSMGYTFFLLGMYNSLEKRKLNSFLFLILAALTHFSYLLYLPVLFLISRAHNKKIIFTTVLLLYAILSSISLNRIALLLYNIFPMLSVKMLTYSDIYQDTTVPILTKMLLVSVFAAILFFIGYYKYIPRNIFSIFTGTLLVVLLTLPFNVIVYDRFVQVFKPVFAITLIITIGSQVKTLLRRQFLSLISLFLYLPFAMYYIYTFYAIYAKNLKAFWGLKKLLLVSILQTTYDFDYFLIY